MPGIRAISNDSGAIDNGRVVLKPPEKIERPSPDVVVSRLLRTIEGEVIPRLLLVHGTDRGERPRGEEVSRADVEALTSLLLMRSEPDIEDFIAGVERRGVSTETIFAELLGASARLLGVMWEQDLCDFTDVTVGLSRLQRTLHRMSCRFDIEGHGPSNGRAILLAPTPGEQHSFGLSLVSEFFRRAGWEVHEHQLHTEAELIGFARRHPLSMVGFSLSSETLLERLDSVIKAVRANSVHRGVGVMVGGRFFHEHPDYVAEVGADATALDGRQAVVQAESLYRLNAPKAR